MACSLRRREGFFQRVAAGDQYFTHLLRDDHMFKFDAQPKDFRSFGYAKAMRSIGLLLEMRNVQAFDMKCDTCEFRLECGHKTPPCSTPIELRYSLDEIDSLERENQKARNGLYEKVDFFRLSEILRALGRYVDKKGGRLVRVSNNDSNMAAGAVRLEYESCDGEQREEVFTLSSIYDICVRIYKERDKTKTPTHRFARSRR